MSEIKNKIKNSVVIVAAGSGKRFGENKMLAGLAGESVIGRTLENFLKAGEIDEIILVVSEKYRRDFELIVVESFGKDVLTTGKIREKKFRIIIGGKERWISSLKGIEASSGEVVIIHDGARPFIEQNMIKESLLAARKDGASVVAVPTTNSIKMIDESGKNISAIPRDRIWLAQTPQTFRRELILKAYEMALKKNYLTMTDESELVTNLLNKPVTIVAGSEDNIKITYPDDLELAERIYERRSKK